ncbi:hypothetical protein LCGC14_3109620, partial [marine sediment metagenome]
MSEKNDEKWRSYALDNRNKITELEKKVNTQAEKIKGFQFTVNRFLKKNLERIEKFEVRSAAHTEVLQVMVEDYYEGTFKECMLESLGGEKTVESNVPGSSVREALSDSQGTTDSKPPRVDVYQYKGKLPRYENMDPAYHKNPSEYDASSARQTELYCHCCGTVILEEKDRFCSSCFNDVQKMQKEKEPTECDDCPIENHKRSDCMVCQK